MLAGMSNLNPEQFKTTVAPMMSDPDDEVGSRCFAEGGPPGLPCIRRKGHHERGAGPHRAFQGEDPKKRAWYEWGP